MSLRRIINARAARPMPLPEACGSRRVRLSRARVPALFGLVAASVAHAGNGSVPGDSSGAPVEDDHVYVHAVLDELEGRFGGGPEAALRWEGEAWAGTDTQRLWLKSEGQARDGQTQGAQHELLYAHPVSEFFDLQAGLRYDLDSRAGRGWAAVGIEGLAPQFFKLSLTAYASDGGHLAAKLRVSRELLLTQRLILESTLEVNGYTRSDPARGVGAGLSDLEAGLRLRYEISRKFAPYGGVVLARDRGPGSVAGGATHWRFALGLRAWL